MKLIRFILLLLCPLFSYSQKSNFKEVFILQVASGFADGTNQAIVHHRLGQGKAFWDFKTSWKRKYKNFDGGDLRPRFPGSKTVFVGATDGFHLTRAIQRSADIATICISVGDSWKDIKRKAIAATIGRGLGWFVSYIVAPV